MNQLTKGAVDGFKAAHRSMNQRSILFITCLAVLMAQAGITLYLPSLPRIAEELQAGSRFAGMTLGLFLLGMGAPMLLWGRLCAAQGNSRTLSVALFLYGASSLLLAATSESWTFLTLRLLQGIGAGGASVSARGLLRECFHGYQLAKALSALSICFVLSLGIVQFLGSVLDASSGWRPGFALIGVAGLLLGTSLIPAGKRTTKPRHAPDWSVYLDLLRAPSFIRPVVAGGLGYTIIVVFNGLAPSIFQQQFNWTSLDYGLLGWPISVAYLLGTLLVNRLASPGRNQFRLFNIGLLLLPVGAALMTTGALLFAGDSSLALWLSYCLILIGQGISYPLCQFLACQQQVESGPQAMALIGLLHQLMAVLAGVLVSLLPTESQALSLACLTIALTAWLYGRTTEVRQLP
ncbi:MFS transporter [Pseudomonas asplenii]|uniref:MFS transporter n=1 Tax=Pseudomonas asplenii TaxID=53407 RepID=UPI00128F6158|nr:MFS transporter [Pseudomonas fuscovaginae]